MVMPTQRSGSRNDAQPRLQAGRQAQRPADSRAHRQADDQALERDEELDPERAAPGQAGQGPDGGGGRGHVPG